MGVTLEGWRLEGELGRRLDEEENKNGKSYRKIIVVVTI